jgi:signal peptidase II
MLQKSKYFLFSFCVLLFVLIDNLTKNWAKKNLFYERSKSYFGGLFTVDYAENKGAALSFGSNLPENQAFLVLQILPAIVLILILLYALKSMNTLNLLNIVGYAGIFAGGFANLYDRFLNKRHVIDFMIINVGGFETGIFNAADVFISGGVLILFFGSLSNKKLSNS